MNKKSYLRMLLFSAIIASLLTGFFWIHESLPAALRAPSSLLLTPIAICSGLCYYLNIPLDFYKSVPLQFLACLVFAFAALWLFGAVRRWFRARTTSGK